MSNIKRKITFVEDKRIDFESLERTLQPSIIKNHYSNFGPVSQELENELASINGIKSGNDQKKVCCGASATALISATVSALDNYHDRTLKWVTSDFGFFTNFTGPLENAVHVPCDQKGMLDLCKLSKIPDGDYEVILVTNVFGAYDNFDEYFSFAKERNKILVIDNAAGFGALKGKYDESNKDSLPSCWIEIISLHHTKPWGMGEGGAIFAPAPLIPLIRSSINFGIGTNAILNDLRYCFNGKMSEISAAAILIRAKTSSEWVPLYRKQAERVYKLGIAAGLTPFVDLLPKEHAIGQVAFQLKKPINRDRLQTNLLPIEKYYRPTKSAGKLACDLYDCMINVPCHPGVSLLSDDEILQELVSIKG